MERELSVLSYSLGFRIRLESEGGRTFNKTSLVKLSVIDRILFYVIDVTSACLETKCSLYKS